MSDAAIATCRFDMADQERFARLSGDCNPMHVDPLAARRTQAGAPVVHGLHSLLWAIDALIDSENVPAIARINATFEKLVYVGAVVQLHLVRRSDAAMSITLVSDGVLALRAQLHFGPPGPEATPILAADAQPDQLTVPRDLDLDAMPASRGRLPYSADPAWAQAFPAACAAFGIDRVIGLAGTSTVIGMACPGLHSIFVGLDIAMTAPGGRNLDYAAVSVDERVRLVQLRVAGLGISGTLMAFARLPPTAQPGMAEIVAAVEQAGLANAFAGSTALVIGGSRGLGEVCAKILAAGGAHVQVTYATGAADAVRVRDDIIAAGRTCGTLRYDVRAPAELQLAGLPEPASHAYFFATPAIFKQKSGLFQQSRFDEFISFYVTGFADFAQTLMRMRPAGVGIFYPSSVAVTTRPRDMTEYAMAKAAGEILSEDLAKYLKKLRIVTQRLPRLATDQTASFLAVDEQTALDVLLPIVQSVQAQV